MSISQGSAHSGPLRTPLSRRRHGDGFVPFSPKRGVSGRQIHGRWPLGEIYASLTLLTTLANLYQTV